jgi:hypothetical protein
MTRCLRRIGDIQYATGLARDMVTQWGMSDKLGPLQYEEQQGEITRDDGTKIKPSPIPVVGSSIPRSGRKGRGGLGGAAAAGA